MDLAMKMVGGGAMAGGGMSSTANLLPAAVEYCKSVWALHIPCHTARGIQ